MSRRKKIMIILGVVLALAPIVWWTANRTPHRQLTMSSAVASNISFAEQMDENTLQYFSGSAFVSYNLMSFTTEPLTPFYSLPTIVSRVVWSRQGALFNASGYSQSDQLYVELVKNKLSPNRYYWWWVDFTSGSIRLVGDVSKGADVRGAVWQDDTTFAYAQKTPGTSGQTVIRQTGTDATTVATLPEDNDVLIGATSNQLLYTRPTSGIESELFSLDIDSKKSTTIAKQVLDVLAVGRNNSVLMIKRNKGDDTSGDSIIGRLVLYDNTKNSIRELSRRFTGTATWRRDGDTWLAMGTSGNNQPMGFVQDGTLEYGFVLPGEKDAQDRHYTAVGTSSKGLLITDTYQQLHILSTTNPNKLPAPPDYTKLSNGVYESLFTIVYTSGNRQYSVYITQNPYNENQQAVIDYLKNQGFDPYQLKLKWYAYDGVDSGFLLPPGMEPIEEPILPAADYFDAGD